MAIHRLSSSEIASFPMGLHHDGAGLYLEVRSKTSASWIYRYQLNGKSTRMGLGKFPLISLKRARQLHLNYRQMRAEGVDPVGARVSVPVKCPTVAEALDDFFTMRKKELKGDGEAGMWWSPVRNHVLPKLGKLKLNELNVDVITGAFRKPWEDVYPTATKAWSRFAQSVTFAADDNFDLSMLKKARTRLGTPKREVKHLKALEWKKIPKLYRDNGTTTIDLAFCFFIMTIPRVANVTGAVWDEFDLAKGIWHLPFGRMKVERPFRVPLSAQATAILRQMKRRTEGEYVFPSNASKYGIISLNTFNKRLGASSTAHGLRSTFADWSLDNKIADVQLTDRCLAHQTLGKVTRAYLRSDMIEDRRGVMQQWADFLTGDTPESRADIQDEKLALHHQKRGFPKDAEEDRD
ncbi:MAG: integrase [Candidatus Azotimanducaceae bacterium]|jgi:integrase